MNGLQAAVDRLREEFGELVEQHDGRHDPERYAKYRDDPAGFCREVLKIVHWWDGFDRICENLLANDRTFVQSCHAIGKDFLTMALAAWWVLARKGLVIALAPTDRQALGILGKELRDHFHRGRLPGQLFQRAWRCPWDSNAGVLLMTGDTQTSKLQGFHAPRILVVLSEAQELSGDALDAANAVAVGEEDRFLALANPIPSPTLTRLKQPGAGWKRLKFSAFDHPNVKAGRTIIPGAVTQAYINRTRAEYGEGSPQWQIKVLGEEPSTDTSAVVTLDMLEAAAARFESGEMEERREGQEQWYARYLPCHAALDPARMGSDLSALAIRQGPILRHLILFQKHDLMELTGLVVRELNDLAIPLRRGGVTSVLPAGHETARLTIDEIGLGVGVLDRLAEQRFAVAPFNGSKTPDTKREAERYSNTRAASYLHFRTLLQKGRIALPRDAKLFEELMATTMRVLSNGRTILDPKEEIKGLIGRSPDRADAVVTAFYNYQRDTGPFFQQVEVIYAT